MEKVSVMPDEGVPPVADLSDEQKRRRRARSVALALVLAGLVFVLWLVTILKLGPGVAVEPF